MQIFYLFDWSLLFSAISAFVQNTLSFLSTALRPLLVLFSLRLTKAFVSFQVSQLTPCQGCPSLGAPLHGIVTISTLETTHNATLGWEWCTVCWISCGSLISCRGICIQLFPKNWFLLHISSVRITMLDNFFEFISDWMVSMQFFQVLS